MSSVLGSFRRAREWAYPQLTSSAFLDKGVLTPEEFIIAGKCYASFFALIIEFTFNIIIAITFGFVD
jgi:hypothetical protein